MSKKYKKDNNEPIKTKGDSIKHNPIQLNKVPKKIKLKIKIKLKLRNTMK